MLLYQNKYRVESIRLKEWDYTNPRWYFVTINTKNHVHGIIIINQSVETTGSVVSKTNRQINGKPIPETIQQIASTTLKSNSLGSIVGQFKSVCTKHIHSIGHNNFAWQPRFYDRIIRNEKELSNIRKYIAENPMRREFEKNIPDNIFE